MKFIYRLKYAIDSPDSPPLFQEKPVIEGPPIETGGDKGEDKKEVEVKGDEGDVPSIGFGDMGGSGDSGGVETPAMTPAQPVEMDPQEALDETSRETVHKEIKRLKEKDELSDPEEIKKELEDEGWEESRLDEIFDLNKNQQTLEEVIKSGRKRRRERIARILNG